MRPRRDTPPQADVAARQHAGVSFPLCGKVPANGTIGPPPNSLQGRPIVGRCNE